MTLLKLTNASPEHKNNSIIVNIDGVISIHRSFTVRPARDGKEEYTEEVTFIHCPPYGTWEVYETMEEIQAKLGDLIK